MGGNTGQADAFLTLTANGTADGHHRHGAETHPVGAEQDHLDHILTGLHAAIAPDLDLIAQAGFDQGAVGLDNADLGRQAGVLQGVLAGRPRTAVVTA